MVPGFFLALGGTVATLLTFIASRNFGGGGYIFWGIIVFGLYNIIRGAIGWGSLKESYPEIFKNNDRTSG